MLQTTPASSTEDVRRFFDQFADQNFERHGHPDRLLRYRTRLLDRYANLKEQDIVLDIGCGNGNHLYALDGKFNQGIGVDLSPGMVASAERSRHPFLKSGYRFYHDDAQELDSQADYSVDVAICVGALEHMLDKSAALQAAFRVLRKKGRFVCLTLNDQFIWYRKLAPALGLPTRHLATDQRLDTHTAHTLLQKAGFTHYEVSYWSFVPGGDMPATWSTVCHTLEGIGRFIAPQQLRGGLVLYGEK